MDSRNGGEAGNSRPKQKRIVSQTDAEGSVTAS